jgi:MurNAc alpha-1-phosphate uridylyltransferase
MRGMILAAGRGQRMGRLTDDTPKALLRLGQKYLIEYSISAMTKIGIKEIVINVSYLREKIKLALGDGKQYGVHIQYSEEEEALETGGGIYQALPLLGDEPFLVLSCDIISDYALEQLPTTIEGMAHLVLVNNPEFNARGDFNLVGNNVNCDAPCSLTYANIGLLRPELFSVCKPGKFKLGEVLKKYATQGLVTGEHFNGSWYNLGTEEQLLEVNSSSLQDLLAFM